MESHHIEEEKKQSKDIPSRVVTAMQQKTLLFVIKWISEKSTKDHNPLKVALIEYDQSLLY